MADLASMKTALEEASGVPFAMFAWATQPDTDYGVLGVVGTDDAVYAEGTLTAYAVSGYVDLVLHDTGDDKIAMMNKALNDMPDVAAELINVWFDKDISAMHYTWQFGAVMD